MHGTFWSNTIWFILLGITTLAELVLLLWKTERRWFILAFYFTISGLSFCFEMTIHSFFHAYTYIPKLIPHSPPDDAIAGNLFSQFSVSATAVVIVLFRLRYYWNVLFAVAYGAIEELFLHLGIYKHYWYRTWMTLLFLLIFFWIAKRAYDFCFNSRWRFWRYPFIFLGLVTLYVHSIGWALKLAGVRAYNQHLFGNSDRSIVFLSALDTIVLGSIIMYLYFSKIKWKWKVPVVLVLYGGLKGLEHIRIIHYSDMWFLAASSICIGGMYFYTYLLDQMYNQVNKTRVS